MTEPNNNAVRMEKKKLPETSSERLLDMLLLLIAWSGSLTG
jgi:hypothetical protein